MIVGDSSIALSSQRTFSAKAVRYETLSASVGAKRVDASEVQAIALDEDAAAVYAGESTSGTLTNLEATSLQRKALALQASVLRGAFGQGSSGGPWQVGATEDGLNPLDDGLDSEMRIMKWVAEAFLGHKIRIITARPANCHGEAAAPSGQQQPAWGINYRRTELYTEAENTSFAAEGWVETAAGQKIAFKLSLEMSREYSTSTQLALGAGELFQIDPLVINLRGGAAGLTDARFDFDLDADGDKESIPFVSSGSAVLVFDKNGDGIANDGSELFGPTTGDGFAELALLDSDGNGWIDEADEEWSQLHLWTKDAEGNDHMQTLLDAGVGAVYLGRVETQFSVRGEGNAELGEVVSTGVYLKEDGQAGTVQQVNLTA